jgi:hypothetical protein
LDDSSDHKKTKPYKQPVPPTTIFKTDDDEPHSERIASNSDHEKGDKKMAEGRTWEKRVAIIGLAFDILLFCATTAYVCVAIKQFNAMRGQLRRMNKALIVSQTAADAAQEQVRQAQQANRPWMYVKSILPIGALQFDPTHKSVNVKIAWMNFGHSPAMNVIMDFRFFVGTNSAEMLKRRAQQCDRLDFRERGRKTGLFMLPDDPITRPALGLEPGVEVDALAAAPNSALRYWFSTCSGYEDESFAREHLTEIVWEWIPTHSSPTWPNSVGGAWQAFPEGNKTAD